MKTIYKNQKIKILIAGLALVLVASLGFFVQSCSQEDDNIANLNCDFQNPYDYVGKYHNEGLMYVLNNIKDSIKLKSDIGRIEQNASDLTKEFCLNNPIGNSSFSEEHITSAIQKVKDIRLKSNNNDFTQTQLYYHQKFYDILKNPRGCSSLSDVFNQIRIVEKEIYDSNMSNEDKVALLVTYAVGRNSLDFWTGLNTKINPPRLKSNNESSSWSFSDWWSKNVTPAINTIVASDFTGAAAGFLQGLIDGAAGGTVIAPGPGTITGAITGGVVGGASGAVYSSVVGGVLYYFTK